MSTQKIITILLSMLTISIAGYAQKKQTVTSPNGQLKAEITIGEKISYTVSHGNDLLLNPSTISMKLNDKTLGEKSKLSKATTKSNNSIIQSPLYKRAEIKDVYNELNMDFKQGFTLIFRAYDDGIAYRFSVKSKKPFQVENEQVEFNFPTDAKAYIPYVRDNKGNIEKQFFNSFENTYTISKLSEWENDRLAFLPILIEAAGGKKICITESELINYPGLYLNNIAKKTTLEGVFAPYVKETKQGGHNELQQLVTAREPYIARYDASQEFPWRIITVAEKDAELLDNDLVYQLASPCKIEDISWIKPGKVAWDWWNAWNLFNVDFEAGINNETYKYYIDFASDHAIEYVILDEGWAVNKKADLFQVIPQINLPELVDYAKKKNVELILWAGYYAFDRDMEKICKHYSEMGIKGFKVDFMDRDDQYMVDFHHRAAEMTAKYKLLVDFHGTYKPVGLNRTYPNVINYEGVHGLEQMKWSSTSVDQVTYDVIMPFIRMLAGPIDYTQGAMRNATKGNYRPVNSEAMSQGTRCRQLAQYIIFESPLNMMCDNPSNYMLEKECTAFISAVPTVWDNTIALDGKIGEYIAIARQHGNDWYVGAMTNWNERTLDIDLSFLPDGNYQVEIYQDGVNANRVARDYKKVVGNLPGDKKMKINMKQGGGWVAKIMPR